MKYVYLFLVGLMLLGNAVAQETKPTTPKIPDHCVIDADCKALPMVNNRCSHFCNGDECKADTPICEVHFKQSGISAAECIQNAACKAPTKITCENKTCIAHP